MKWFDQLKVHTKFLVIGLFILPFLVALGGAGVWGATQINQTLQDVQGEQIPSILNLSRALEKIQSSRSDVQTALLDAGVANSDKYIQSAKDNEAQARTYLDTYLATSHGATEDPMARNINPAWTTWSAETTALISFAQQNTSAASQSGLALLAQNNDHALVDSLSNIIDFNAREADGNKKAASDTYNTIILLISFSAFGVVLIIFIAMWVLSRSIIRMTNDLSTLNQEVAHAVRELKTAANDLLAMTNQQTAGVAEQAAAIHQTTSTVNEVKATTDQTNHRARGMSDSALRSVSVADEGQQAVSETVNGMSLIKEQVETIAENILALSEQTQQIGEIIASVNDIAEQSNLLALNAAIEAARAGEHGRGFAVVASEVRTLAERSKSATAQVRTILNDIQKATNAVVMVTEEGTKGVDHGVRLVDRAGQTIRQLSEVIRENLASTQQIIAVVQQQNVGVEQVAQAITNINDVTNQSAAAARQLQQSVESMNSLADRLDRLTTQNAMPENIRALAA